jgi:hypothetical protein
MVMRGRSRSVSEPTSSASSLRRPRSPLPRKASAIRAANEAGMRLDKIARIRAAAGRSQTGPCNLCWRLNQLSQCTAASSGCTGGR